MPRARKRWACAPLAAATALAATALGIGAVATQRGARDVRDGVGDVRVPLVGQVGRSSIGAPPRARRAILGVGGAGARIGAAVAIVLVVRDDDDVVLASD